MHRSRKFPLLAFLVLFVCFAIPVPAQKAKKDEQTKRVGKAALWRDPGSVGGRNMVFGQGGRLQAPKGKFAFLEEDKGGTQPKFDVRDEQGTRWRVKLGPESRSETAASRFVWVVGYHTDEDYYLPELRVEGMKKLRRGSRWVTPHGTVRGARLERRDEDRKKIGEWNWSKNPFIGTKEMNGLRVMMALINNWDLKNVNTAIYELPQGERYYVVSDLGGTFGKAGGLLTLSKGNVKHYAGSRFIRKVRLETADFDMHNGPPALEIFYPPLFFMRHRMKRIGEDIPLDHVRWIGGLLAQLSEKQISDAFYASGYTPSEVRSFTTEMRERIRTLNGLTSRGSKIARYE